MTDTPSAPDTPSQQPAHPQAETDGPMSGPGGAPGNVEDSTPQPSPQPPPYQGVYGQASGAAPSVYGQQPPAAEPHDPAHGQHGQHGQYGQRDPAYRQYDPRYGYGPPGIPQHPQQVGPAANDTLMAVLAYALGLVAGWLGPLIIYIIKKNESQYVRFHAAQALNSYLTYLIMVFGAVIATVGLTVATNSPYLVIPGVIAVVTMLVSHIVYLILALIRANRGEYYRLPTLVCFRMVR